MIDFLKKRWVYHFLIWLAGFGVMIIAWIASGPEETLEAQLGILAYFVPIIPIVYLNFYFKSIFFDKSKYWKYLLSIPIQVAVGVIIYELDYLLFVDFKQSWLQDANNIFFIIAFTTGLQYLKRGIVNQYQIQVLRAKNAEMELNSLKAQINPHFLFNNLNNIYSINQIDHEKGTEMILELAEVMRYHLASSKKKKVSLQDEVQLVRSYIELEKLRLQDNCKLEIAIEEPKTSSKISPLLLLPFIENAFKHGTHPTLECFVKISITSTDQEIHFSVLNSIINNKNVVKTNLGLENTQRRLELLYPESHKLEMNRTQETYAVKLEIQL